MHIAVTGASGFIGARVCAALAAAGHTVRGLVRKAGTAPTKDEFVTGDLQDFDEWPRAFDGLDGVVHLAAVAHGRGDATHIARINVVAAEAAARAACAAALRFVFVSSVKVLGEETATRPFDASSPWAPADAYGRAKADAERRLLALKGLQLTILRPPLVYGEGVKANFRALAQVVARGWPLPFASIQNRRSLLYVGSLADAIRRALVVPAAVGKTYLVSDGAAISTPDLCRALGEALGRPALLFAFPVSLLELAPPLRRLTRSLEVDDSAIRQELDWKPPYTFEEGLRLTAEWYLAQRG